MVAGGDTVREKGRVGGSGGEIRRKGNGKERERKNERADNKRLTSRLSEWWNFKTLQIKLFIPVYKGRGRNGGRKIGGVKKKGGELVERNRREKRSEEREVE